LNHPIHAPSTIGFTPRNKGVFLIVNARSERHPEIEAVMTTADERAWHRSLEAPNSSAPNNSSLAGMGLLVLKRATLLPSRGIEFMKKRKEKNRKNTVVITRS
jgi:hypothetical protein